MDTNPIGSEWSFAGRDAACSIVNNRLYAVLYWSDGLAYQPIGSEALERSEAGWFLKFADTPDAQLLIVPTDEVARYDLSADERFSTMHKAMEVAGVHIRQRVAERGDDPRSSAAP